MDTTNRQIHRWPVPLGRAAAAILMAFSCGCGGGSEDVTPAAGDSAAAGAEAIALDLAGMVEIAGGDVIVDGETRRVPSFWIDAHEVTNDEFARFVDATGFVTEAETIGDSVVFSFESAAAGYAPFDVVPGASWKHPKGPNSTLDGMGDHPAVHISWNDAVAYASWCGKRLPTRNEWVAAARGGLEDSRYPWGDEIRPDRQHRMNAWQGVFPGDDRGLDGFRGTAPVGSFAPNAHGVYDMAGNVWEWTAERRDLGEGTEDRVAEKRGGSFLCRERASEGFHACQGYRLTSFEWSPVINGNDNIGFRCAASADAQ